MRSIGDTNKTLRWRVIEYSSERKTPENIKKVIKFPSLSTLHNHFPSLTRDRVRDYCDAKREGINHKRHTKKELWKYIHVEKLDKEGN